MLSNSSISTKNASKIPVWTTEKIFHNKHFFALFNLVSMTIAAEKYKKNSEEFYFNKM